jgi:hypothetical protein
MSISRKDIDLMMSHTRKVALKTNASKEDLDRLKAALEIQQLTIPWWKRPGYLGILLPTLVAFMSVFIAGVNGFFSHELNQLQDTKRGLELQNAGLELDKKNLESERNYIQLQKERTQWDVDQFAQTKKDLIEEVNTRKAESKALETSNLELKGVNTGLVSEKRGLETRVAGLTAEQTRLEGSLRETVILHLKAEIELLKEDIFREDSEVALETAIGVPSQLAIRNQLVTGIRNQLVNTIRNNPEVSAPYVDGVIKEMNENTASTDHLKDLKVRSLRALLRYSLYYGTQKEDSRDAYLGEVRREFGQEKKGLSTPFTHVFLEGLRRGDTLLGKDRAIFCAMFIDELLRSKNRNGPDIDWDLGVVAGSMADKRGDFNLFDYDPTRFLIAAEISRDDLMEHVKRNEDGVFSEMVRTIEFFDLSRFGEFYALAPLTAICPRAYIMIVCSLVMDVGDRPNSVDSPLYERFISVIETLGEPRLRKALELTAVPKKLDSQLVSEWRNKWKQEIEWWREPGLKTLRSNPELLRTLLNSQ